MNTPKPSQETLRSGASQVALLPITLVHTSSGVLVGRNDPYQTGLDYSAAAQQFRAALEQRAMEAAV